MSEKIYTLELTGKQLDRVRQSLMREEDRYYERLLDSEKTTDKERAEELAKLYNSVLSQAREQKLKI